MRRPLLRSRRRNCQYLCKRPMLRMGLHRLLRATAPTPSLRMAAPWWHTRCSMHRPRCLLSTARSCRKQHMCVHRLLCMHQVQRLLRLQRRLCMRTCMQDAATCKLATRAMSEPFLQPKLCRDGATAMGLRPAASPAGSHTVGPAACCPARGTARPHAAGPVAAAPVQAAGLQPQQAGHLPVPSADDAAHSRARLVGLPWLGRRCRHHLCLLRHPLPCHLQ